MDNIGSSPITQTPRMRTMPPATAAPAASPAPAPPAVSDSGARQARFWNRFARRYAAARMADPGGYETTLRRVRELLSADQDVLEIGCGTGTSALRLAPHTRRLLATDVSPAMIAIAQDKLAAAPVPQLGFAVADAHGPPGEPAAFDAVLAFNLLQLTGDLDGALAGVVRALRPGGRLISKTPCVAEMNPLLTHVAIPLLRAVGLAPPVLCFTGAQLQEAVARSGLAIEAVERHGTRGKDIRVFIVARKPG